MTGSNKIIEFGQLGCGRVSSRYLDIFTGGEVAGASLVAACDLDLQRAEKFAAAVQATAYGDLNEMLSETSASVVIISTPSGDHADHIRAVLQSGRHVVVEKPMTMRPEQAIEVTALANEKDLMLCVVKQNRYNPAMRKIKETMATGRFGRLVLGTVRVRWARDMSYYSSDPWRGKFISDGGVITNQAIHHIDALQWVMGPIEAVCASGTAQLNDIEVDDTTVAVIRFKNGALGAIEATTATRPDDVEASLSILGEGGTVVIGGIALNEIESWQFVNAQAGDNTVQRDFSQEIPNAYGLGHAPLLQDVINELQRGGATPPIDGIEGSKSLAVVHALYRSMEDGGWVELDDDSTSRRLGVGPIG